MFVVQELVHSLTMLVNIFFNILYVLLVVRVLLSWFNVNPYTTGNDLLSAVFQITDTILAPFRRLPLRIGMIDLSAIVAFVVIQFIHHVLIGILIRIA